MILVAGITRSGLSLTMQMLQAGGFPVVGEPPAFECFPLGKIQWNKIGERAVKVVDIQLQLPPPRRKYAVIALRRSYIEQAKSINKFNAVFGVPEIPLERLILSLKKDYVAIDNWMCMQRRSWLRLQFENVIRDPHSAANEIQDFLGRPLDLAKMVNVVRKRSVTCYPGMLELELLREANHEPLETT